MFKSRLPRAVVVATILSTALLSIPTITNAQDVSQFATYDAESVLTVDTEHYGKIIGSLSVSEGGRTLMAYEAAHSQALPFFAQYTNYLANIPVERLNRDEQLAYWLNTRNFLLVHALVEERRVRGFKKKRGTPANPGEFWTKKRITVSGVPLSLQDIEQDILFKGWDNPDIIFGLYQGITGGPTLPRTPFRAETVHAELAENGKQFNSRQSNFRVRNETIRISSYYDWYLPLAYGNDESALREHLSAFTKPDQQALVRTDGELTRRKIATGFEHYNPREALQQTGTGARPITRGLGS